jgi:spermidine synthase
MSKLFEELGREPTSMGDISLRRRWEPELRLDVWEVILGDEFLMSSLFTTGERALASLGLADTVGNDLDIVIGGLGLGYTAVEALADDRVASMYVVDTLDSVIGWHNAHLTPLGAELTTDDRTTLVHGNFFELVRTRQPLAPGGPAQLDAILVDIDHSPRHLLDPSHAGFYRPGGLARLQEQLVSGGVFGLWSDAGVDDEFVAVLRDSFASAEAHTVTFENVYTGRETASTIYVAIKSAD